LGLIFSSKEFQWCFVEGARAISLTVNLLYAEDDSKFLGETDSGDERKSPF
jgi:hypothetical protein